MPPLPVIANTFRCAIKHTSSALGQHTVNVIHVKSAGATNADTIWDHLNTAIGGTTPFAVLQNNYDVSGLEVAITPLDGTSPTKSYTSTDAAWSGGKSGDQVPEAAMGLTMYTAKRGRSYRGRVFIGPVSETSLNNGVLNTTDVTNTVTGWTDWQNALVGIGPTMCVASYLHRTSEPLTSFRGHTEARTQRPRLVRLR